MSTEETADFPKTTCLKATDRAILCLVTISKTQGTVRRLWIPQSQVHDDSEVYDDRNNNEGKLVITKWWAEKEGLL